MQTSNRRDFLKVSLNAGFAIGAVSGLAACGSSSGTPASHASTGAATQARKHGGTLNVGLTGGGSSETVDPLHPILTTDTARAINIFDPLVAMDAAGQPELYLAEEITPSRDAKTWTIRVRKGVTFHSGKELTAEDIKASFRLVLTVSPAADGATLLAPIDWNNIKIIDKYTVEVPCHTPFATLVETLSCQTVFYVLPSDFDVKQPNGTGPFKLQSFTPGEETALVRNSDYWNHPLPYLDKVVLTDYNDETSQLNALLSGQEDCVNLLSASSMGEVAGSGKRVLVSPGGGSNPFVMRVDSPPFNDVRVRQAMRLILDRPRMLDTVFDGHGVIGNDIFGIWAPEYDHSIPQRVQDIEQAKSLLKAAGREGLSVEMVTSDIAQGVVQMAEVFAQQASAAGVNVTLRQVTPTDFFGPSYLKWTFAQSYWYYFYYYPMVADTTLPTSPFPETHFNDPVYTKLYSEGLAALDSGRRSEIAHEMQRIDYDQGGYIVPFFVPVIDGYGSNVQGLVPSKTGISFNGWDFKSVALA